MKITRLIIEHRGVCLANSLLKSAPSEQEILDSLKANGWRIVQIKIDSCGVALAKVWK